MPPPKQFGGFFVDTLSIVLGGIWSPHTQINGVIRHVLDYQEVIDYVRLVDDDRELEFLIDRKLDPPLELIKNTLGRNIGPNQIIRHQLHQGDYGYFGEKP